MDFTASDSSPRCKLLKENIFGRKEFLAESTKQFVLVEVDQPHSTQLPQKVAAQNNKLRDQYGVAEVPTVLVLNADGQKIKRTTGFSGKASWQDYTAGLATLYQEYGKIVELRGEAKAAGASIAPSGSTNWCSATTSSVMTPSVPSSTAGSGKSSPWTRTMRPD